MSKQRNTLEQRLVGKPRRPLIKRELLVSAALCIIGAPVAAIAQTTADTPPVHETIDPNGVDLVSGAVVNAGGRVSIGPPSLGLQYTYQVTPAQRAEYPYGTLNRAVNTYTVSLGRQSETFLLNGVLGSGGYFTSVQARGSTLSYDPTTQTCSYFLRDGTVALFPKALAGAAPKAANEGFISSITRPNGEALWYSYVTTVGQSITTQTLKSIRSNTGFQLKFDGATTTALNLAYEYCDPVATCTLSGDWPRVTVSNTSYSTDSLGRTSRYYGTPAQSTLIRPSGLQIRKVSSSDTALTIDNGAGVWSYNFPIAANILTMTVTSPTGQTRVVTANQFDRQVLTDTDGNGHTTSYTYDASKRLTRVTRSEGDYTAYTYDARGNIIEARQVSKTPGSPADIVTTYGFAASCSNPKTCNQPNYVIDPRGNRTDYTYDPTHGGVLTVTKPAGASGVRPQTRYTYQAFYAWYKDASNAIVQAPSPVYKLISTSQCASSASCAGSAEETRVSYSYGASGVANNLMPTAMTVAAGDGSLSATTTYTYDANGDIKTVDGPLPGAADTTIYRRNSARQLVGMVSPDPDGAGALRYRAERYTYDLDGHLTNTETGAVAGQTDADWAGFSVLRQDTQTYDLPGRKVQQSVVVGGTTQAIRQYSYDASNRLICTAVRLNPATFSALPASACTLSTTGADGPDRINYRSYDNANQLTALTAGYGTAAPRNEFVGSYTANGRILTSADGAGNLTTYEYDGFDRLAKTRYPNGSGGGSSTADFDSYVYDAASNIVQASRRGALTNYAYDALNRLTYKDNTPSWYYYDNLSRPTVTYSGASAEKANLQYYDGLGRPSWTYDWTGSAWRLANYATYDLAGQQTMLQWADGFYVNYDYDAAGEVTGVRENGGTQLVSYTYDDLGRRTGTYRGNGAQSFYNYDAAGRLGTLTLNLAGTAQDQVFSYAYNAAGQIKTRTSNNDAYLWTGGASVNRSYTINGLNQVTAIGGVGTAHDTKGNLTNDGTGTYSYDTDNRLTGASTGAVLAYDPLGRLGKITGAATTQFVYSGPNLIAELDAAGNVLRRYVPGPGSDEPLLWYEGAGTADRRYLLPDERGSIVAVADATGAATINTYDEYGMPGAGNQGRYQYTGQTFVSELGLYNYKARMYSPTLGRFMQTDPIGYEDGLNLYRYVGNDPINQTDPTGLAAPGSRCFVTDPNCSTEVTNFDDVVVVGKRRAPPPVRSGRFSENWKSAGRGRQRPAVKVCPVITRGVYNAETPFGAVSLPELAPGAHVVYGYLGADAAAGFGVGGSVGYYSYRASNGTLFGGFYVSPAVAVGVGASVSAQGGASTSLGSFFGNSASVSGSLGVFGFTASGNENGASVDAGLSAGAKFMGESSFAMPLGNPQPIDC